MTTAFDTRWQGSAAEETLNRIRRISADTVALPAISPLEQRLATGQYAEEEEKKEAEIKTVADEFDRILCEKVRIACQRIDAVADEYALKNYPSIDEVISYRGQETRVRASSNRIIVDVNHSLSEPSLLNDDPRTRVTMSYHAGKTTLSFRNYRSGRWFVPYIPATFFGAPTVISVVAAANGVGPDESIGLAIIYGIPFLISAALGAYRTWSRLHYRGRADRLADEPYDTRLKAEGAEQLMRFPTYLKEALEQHYARPKREHNDRLEAFACERDRLLDATMRTRRVS